MKFSLKKEMQFKKAAETFLCVWAYAELIHFICLLCVRLLVLYECVWFKTCASHKRPTWLVLFQPHPTLPPPLCGRRASESGVQNVILWWENFGGRGKNRLGKVGQNRNLSLPNVPKPQRFQKIQFSRAILNIMKSGAGVIKTTSSHILKFCSRWIQYLSGII